MYKKSLCYVFSSFILILFVFSCKKDNGNKTGIMPVADIVTLKDSLMNGGGVRLFGQIKPNDQITDYGFEYGTDSLLSLPVKISKGKTVEVNFNADVIDGLVYGQKYFFRAYELVNGTEKWGDVKFFVSQGSKPLILTSVFPSTACMLDTITIHGKNFDVNKTNAYFDNYASQILSINDSVMVCIIPNIGDRYNGGVSLKDKDNIRSTYANFSLATPVITAVSDKKALGDTVEIDGKNLDKAINFTTEVDFGTVKAQIISTSKTKMKVIVPTFYYASVPITVTSQFQTVKAPSSFTVAPPVITQVPASAGILSTLTISGKNFSPIYYYDYDQVFVSGVKANIFKGNKNSISIQVPDAPYPNRTATVSVDIFGQTTNYSGTVNITDKWVMIANNIPFSTRSANNAFVVNNQAYCFTLPNGVGPLSVYKYNVTANSWSQVQQLAGLSTSMLASQVSNGSRVFLYTSGADSTGKFWEYIPASQQLVARAKFPGAVRGFTAMFYIGNTVYLGFGSYGRGYTDFYAYNTQTDTWKQVSGMNQSDFGGFITGFFTIGNNGYILYQSYFGSYLWQYNSLTDTWTRKADFQALLGTSFVINGNAYLCGAGIYYKYDSVADTWTKGTALGSGDMVYSQFGFTLGSKSYVGNTDNNKTSTYLYSANNSDL